MADIFAEKTQKATPYQQQQARRRGQVARSADLTTAVVLVGFGAGLTCCTRALVTSMSDIFATSLSPSPLRPIDGAHVFAELRVAMISLARISCPLLAGMMLLALLAHVVQGSMTWRPSLLWSGITRVGPWQRLGMMFSFERFVSAVMSLAKLAAVLAVVAAGLWHQRRAIVALTEHEVEQLATELPLLALRIGMWATAALLVLGLADFGLQHWFHNRRLRMTSDEMREETRAREGEPRLRARRRTVHNDLVRSVGATPEQDGQAAATSSTYPNRWM